MIKARFKDITDALESVSADFTAYLKIATGQVIKVSEEYRMQVDFGGGDEDRPEWEVPIIEEARDVVDHPDRYLELPTQFDIDEYSIMENFCLSQPEGEIRERLLGSIRGKGAFRRFKDQVTVFEISDEWYKYKKEKFAKIAKDWCENSGVVCEIGEEKTDDY